MSRNKKRTSIMGRSDIPLVERMALQRRQEISSHRDEAARLALKLACVALNDTEGLGYVRLTRFARRLHDLIDEYYSDPEIESAHLNARLEQLGFRIGPDGGVLAAVDSETGAVVPWEKEGGVFHARKI